MFVIKVIASWCYGEPMWCTRPGICLLSDSWHSLQLRRSIPECNDLSQFKEDTGRRSVPVWEIDLIAYLPLVQPTENHPDVNLNPGHHGSSASQVQQALWLGKHISPLSHADRHVSRVMDDKLVLFSSLWLTAVLEYCSDFRAIQQVCKQIIYAVIMQENETGN